MKVVVGGGIAGVSCAQELARLCPGDEILLITSTATVMESRSVFTWTKLLEEVDIFEKTVDEFRLSHPNVRVVTDTVYCLDVAKRTLYLQSGNNIQYSDVVLCTGARPAVIADHPKILGIRDLFSVSVFAEKLGRASRVAIVGNGGIALELVYELKNIEIDWIVREHYLGAAFFDATASDFVKHAIASRLCPDARVQTREIVGVSQLPMSEVRPVNAPSSSSPACGSALGPAWLQKSRQHISLATSEGNAPLRIFHGCELAAFSDSEGKSWQWILSRTDLLHQKALSAAEAVDSAGSDQLLVLLSSGECISCDLLVSATGIKPAPQLDLVGSSVSIYDSEGFVNVDGRMQTAVPHVYAAGDCCSFTATSPHFFQRKLWTQARVFGTYAAQCVCGVEQDYGTDQSLELFAHVTRFFGHKVVLLGRYNAQGLGDALEYALRRVVFASSAQAPSGDDASAVCQPHSNASSEWEVWTRIHPGRSFVKILVHRGKVVGALLVGDSDLEETFENLILNQLDVSQLGPELLDPEIDLVDYFD